MLDEPMSPGVRLLALLLGHEARITDEQWSEVRAMACPNCEAMDWPNLPDGSYACSACHQTYYLRTSGVKTALPQVTHYCPNCEAAARERDAAYEDARQMQERLQRLIDAEPQRELADLRARIAATAQTYSRDMHISADLGDLLEDLLTELRALLAEKETE